MKTGGDALGLDVDAQVEAFAAEDTDVAKLDPDRTARDADRLHDQTVGISLLVAALVGVVVLLTVAWLSRARLQVLLIGCCMAAYAGLAVGGVVYAW